MQPNGQMSRFGAMKVALHRLAFGVLVAAAFGLMLLGKADTVLISRISSTVIDALTPVLEIMSKPAASVGAVMNNIRELAAIREENARLREENRGLLRWQTVARELQVENQRLRELANLVPEPAPNHITARVVADTGGVFARSLLVTAGTRDGARKGQVVVAAEGLVGRLTEVGGRSSRVLLLTDINSRVPVIMEESRARAILMGTNDNRPELAFMKAKTGISPGDRIVTSGTAGAFPPDIPVGVVASVDDGHIRVELLIEEGRLDLVRILDYGIEGIVPDPGPGVALGGR
ncbi:rod shape-determining protein MreC [Roseospira navarrensis]|uniref:Cell shape-determining protein MreC n=1 Tax=Roseospira navarrensis TaxID=140058 RepID=A0A7X1ZEM5_9PROT|nr:rod shape-determining protein MreC [Roseospira navarrensis]MQX37160.1 rod shape-determining protein MreC [Roseospira navarrensis]